MEQIPSGSVHAADCVDGVSAYSDPSHKHEYAADFRKVQGEPGQHTSGGSGVSASSEKTGRKKLTGQKAGMFWVAKTVNTGLVGGPPPHRYLIFADMGKLFPRHRSRYHRQN